MSRLSESLEQAAAAARACTLCAGSLPHGVNPVLRVHAQARLLIVGQAPGARVHATGLPFDDPSGSRLRGWLGVDRETFYDASRIAFMPTGLCYPGTDPKGGDRPPMRVCAPTWHPRIRPLLPDLGLTLLVGSYAQAFYLGRRRARTMSETVRRHEAYRPAFWPIPHPSWRVNAWLKKNAWFESEVLPALRARVAALIDSG